MTNMTFHQYSLAQLITALATSTSRLVSLMNQKRVPSYLIRKNKNEIEALKATINERKVTYGRF